MKIAVSVGPNRKAIWIVSAGGHLSEAVRLDRMLGTHPDTLWVTPETDHARSLLEGRRTLWVPYVSPRDYVGAFRTAGAVNARLRKEQFDVCISTGAAMAAFALPLARLRGIRTIFVESLARTSGASLTGKMLRLFPGVETNTQYPSNARRGWNYAGSLLDEYSVVRAAAPDSLKIFVTLGTIRPYRFDRAVDAVLSLASDADSVVWQLGETTRDSLPGTAHLTCGADDMRREIERADVVISHAGVGTILDVLDAGKTPVLIPRSADHNEHVDNHQDDIVREMVTAGFAVRLDHHSPDRELLLRAAENRVARRRPVAHP